MAEPRWLTDRESRAWRGYMQMRGLLDLQISRDLARDAGLSEADYTVLAVLSETPEGRMRLIDLAGRMLWSTSRLAHHLDRMQRRGLVRREEHPINSRARVAALTERGRLVIDEAAPHHVDSVRRHFIDLLTDQQIDALGDVTQTVLDRLRGVADPANGNDSATSTAGQREGTSKGFDVRELLTVTEKNAVSPKLGEDVVFHSPVADYGGRDVVGQLLATIAGSLTDVRSIREFVDGNRYATEFSGRVGDAAVDGMLTQRLSADGMVEEATLWLRPLAALRSALADA
jgi:DNA-binding MarR family transcriptional regulator